MIIRERRLGVYDFWAYTGAVTFTIFALISITSFAQSQPENWEQQLINAQELVADGQVQDAISLYREAANSASNRQKRAEVLLRLGALFDQLSLNQTEYLNESATVFREAMELATGRLKLQVASNYATQLLRLGNTQEATAVLNKIWSEYRNIDLDRETRSRFLYNYARALEHNRKYEAAVELYNQSYKADPDFDPAARAIARLALQSPSETMGIPQLLGLITGLIKQGDYEAASNYIKEGLMVHHWIGHPDYPRLVTQMVSLFIAARTSPEEYKEKWRTDLLLPYRQFGPGSHATKKREDINQVYTGFLHVTFEKAQARSNFDAWDAPGEYEVFSRFVKMVGDHFFRKGDLERALELYSNAWALDTTNMEAGLYLANLLTAEAERIDPEGAYLHDFLFFAFSEKAKAYLGEEWSSILKFHTVLGTLFERQENWGPDTIPRTAAFQWKHALRAHAQLAKEHPETTQTVPAIHANLGRAYAMYGENDHAWKQYIISTEDYFKLGRRDAARAAFDSAITLDHIPNAHEQERLLQLHLALWENKDRSPKYAKTINIKIGWASSDGETDPYAITARQFAMALEKESPGQFQVEFFPNSQLGNEWQMIESLSFGALQMAVIANASIASIEPAFQINDMPFLYTSESKAHAVLDSEAGLKLMKKLESKNIFGLGFSEEGFGQMANNVRPVRTPADLKGMKLRVRGGPERIDMVQAMGGNAVSIAWSELYTSLQQGVIDGSENPIAVIQNTRIYEVTKYLSLTNHTYSALGFLMSKNTWDKLAPEQQYAIRKSARKAIKIQRVMNKENVKTLVEKLKNEGMQINRVEVEDIAVFKQKVRPLYEMLRPIVGDDIYYLFMGQM